MSKPTTAELITMLSEFDCHADVQKLAADRLEAPEINANELSDMRDIISELNTEIRAYRERAITAEVTVTALEDEKAEFEECAKHDIRSYMDINKELLNDMPCYRTWMLDADDLGGSSCADEEYVNDPLCPSCKLNELLSTGTGEVV